MNKYELRLLDFITNHNPKSEWTNSEIFDEKVVTLGVSATLPALARDGVSSTFLIALRAFFFETFVDEAFAFLAERVGVNASTVSLRVTFAAFFVFNAAFFVCRAVVFVFNAAAGIFI